jgi:hypothetical protein
MLRIDERIVRNHGTHHSFSFCTRATNGPVQMRDSGAANLRLNFILNQPLCCESTSVSYGIMALTTHSPFARGPLTDRCRCEIQVQTEFYFKSAVMLRIDERIVRNHGTHHSFSFCTRATNGPAQMRDLLMRLNFSLPFVINK